MAPDGHVIRAEISTLFKSIFKTRDIPVGIVTKIEFITHPNTRYTGCFKGAKHAVMRISETVATSVVNLKTIPGHGIKPDPNEKPPSFVQSMSPARSIFPLTANDMA